MPDFIILEGLKTFELESDLRIWVDIDVKKADMRAENRDVKNGVNPIGFAQFWSDYKNYTNNYIQSFNPKEKADLVICTENEDYEILIDRTESNPNL